MTDILFELGVEELPPKSLLTLSRALALEIKNGLAAENIVINDYTSYAAPRRLAIYIKNLPEKQQDQQVEKKGPPLASAFDKQGNPTKAVQGFARSCGVDVTDLEQIETDKGIWLVYRSMVAGKSLTALLPVIIQQALDKLPIPKNMFWGKAEYSFIRPVHWVVLMQDQAVIPASFYGIQTDKYSRGHRFHSPDPIEITNIADYEEILKNHYVIADFSKRQTEISQQITKISQEYQAEIIAPQDLLDEVTALVEWPQAILGQFEEKFLQVPSEALILTMQENQKYFALIDKNKALMPYFITIANIESKESNEVKQGNERVIRPRFSDAEFFWQQDTTHKLEENLEGLKNVLFQKKLGSLYDKTARIAAIAEYIAKALNKKENITDITRAAWLCKCDLLSDMVNEFPELQGIMAGYYAKHDKENTLVIEGVKEQYLPKSAHDNLPESIAGQCVALADKIDTLVGIFAIGEKPTGVKDPYALRRAALGILKILIEKQLPLNLVETLQFALEQQPIDTKSPAIVSEIFEFVLERLRAYYTDAGVHIAVYEAVFARKPPIPYDFDLRIHAIEKFRHWEAAESLIAANKRISNILKKIEYDLPIVDKNLLNQSEEQALAQALANLIQSQQDFLTKGDYTSALSSLAELKDIVDTFFDHVMVMVEEENLRLNRLALLRDLQALFLNIADVARLASI